MNQEDLLKLKIKLEKRKIIYDIILIIVILFITIYVIKEIELFKALSADVCRMCEVKKGAICFSLNNPQ